MRARFGSILLVRRREGQRGDASARPRSATWLRRGWPRRECCGCRDRRRGSRAAPPWWTAGRAAIGRHINSNCTRLPMIAAARCSVSRVTLPSLGSRMRFT